MTKQTKTKQLVELLNKTKSYEDRINLNISSVGIIEKKQTYNYISWTYADIILRTLDKDSSWEAFESPFPNMVGIKVVFEGKEHKSLFPILDMANRGCALETSLNEELVFLNKITKTDKTQSKIARVTSMDLNNSIMRGFAKEVSKVTGVGIGIYAGEDLSQYDNTFLEEKPTEQQIEEMITLYQKDEEKYKTKLGELINKRNSITNGVEGFKGFIKNLTLDEYKEFVK